MENTVSYAVQLETVPSRAFIRPAGATDAPPPICDFVYRFELKQCESLIPRGKITKLRNMDGRQVTSFGPIERPIRLRTCYDSVAEWPTRAGRPGILGSDDRTRGIRPVLYP
jgi:hypothetical protein